MTAQEWNKRFAALNSVPHDGKANQDALKSYYTQLISSKPSHYKTPDDYPVSTAPVTPSPSAPTVAPITISLQDALKSAQATVKAIETWIGRGI